MISVIAETSPTFFCYKNAWSCVAYKKHVKKCFFKRTTILKRSMINWDTMIY